jgi:hypothetical protein
MPALSEFLINRCRTLIVAAVILPLAVGCAATPPSAAGTPPAGAATTPPATSATTPNTTIVAISPAAAPQQNLLDFLGITAIGKCIGQGVTCIAGLLPTIIPGFNTGLGELANTPPVLPINDPANLKSSNPAVAAAAAAMRDEDSAPQKIAALEYLATRGCSSCVVGSEEAMLAGLDDCIESVRFAAATAIFEAAGKPCKVCRGGNCCTPKIREKLYELGFKLNPDTGCPVEPSPRVRRQARLALRACGPDCNPPVTPVVPTPAEGPDQDAPPATDRPSPSASPRVVPPPPLPGAATRTRRDVRWDKNEVADRD